MKFRSLTLGDYVPINPMALFYRAFTTAGICLPPPIRIYYIEKKVAPGDTWSSIVKNIAFKSRSADMGYHHWHPGNGNLAEYMPKSQLDLEPEAVRIRFLCEIPLIINDVDPEVIFEIINGRKDLDELKLEVGEVIRIPIREEPGTYEDER